jgi:DNA-binding CsgD family transcriptional regulator
MIFGRDSELGSIASVIEAAREGRPSVVVLRGEAGIGKTALLEHAAQVGRDLLVVSARALETETALPCALVSAIARPLMRYASDLPTVQSRCLRSALGEDGAPAIDAFLLGAAMLGMLSAAGQDRPVLLLLDDLHWADDVSLRALVFALRRLDLDPVGALLAQRDLAVPPLEAAGFPVIGPTRLDADSVSALVAAVRGEPPSIDVARQLVELTAGNPLAIVELAGALDRGVLRGEASLPSPLPVGEKLLDLYAQQVRGLTEGTRLALVVAALGDERLGPVLQAAAELQGSAPNFDGAERAGLVAIAGDRIVFRHPLIRAAVIGSADPAVRRAAHRALAGIALLSTEARAWHLGAAAAGMDARAATALAAAARLATSRGDLGIAAEMWSRASELTPDGGERALMLAEAAEAANSVGNVARCRVLVEAGLDATDDPAVRGRLVFVSADLTYLSDPQAVHRIYLEAASLLAPHDGLATVRAITLAFYAGLTTLSIEQMHQSIDRAIGLDRPDEPRTTFFRGSIIGTGLAITGDLVRALPFLEGVLAEIDRNTSFHEDLDALSEAATVAGYFGRVDLASDFAERAMVAARARGMVSWIPSLMATLTEVAIWRAEWARASALATDSAGLAQVMGDDDLRTTMLSEVGRIDAHRGEFASAQEAARTRLRWSDERGIFRERPVALRTLAAVDMHEGRPEQAVRRLLPIMAVTIDGRGVRNGCLTVVEDLVEAAVRSGNTGVAVGPVQRLSAYARLSPDPLASALAARCRAQLAGGDDAAEEYETSLRFHDRDPNAFATARTHLSFGEWLRRRGRRGDAREHLQEALDVFDRLEAVPWLRRTEAELRATGASIGPRHEASTRLTAQELRVAMSVAEGLTNRETADQLFVSVKTVEFHLGSVYRKLGVRSRTELARHPSIARLG